MNHFCVLLLNVNVLVQIDVTTMLQAKVMLNRNERCHKESENFNSLLLKTIHYRVYKCTVILHVTMERAHRESSMSKLDYDAKRVANIYMELLETKSATGHRIVGDHVHAHRQQYM